MQVTFDTRTLLTSVFCSQSQHEAQWEGFGPGHLCSVHQQAKKVGLVWQRQALQGLESGANVEKARMLLAAKKTAVKQ